MKNIFYFISFYVLCAQTFPSGNLNLEVPLYALVRTYTTKALAPGAISKRPNSVFKQAQNGKWLYILPIFLSSL